MRVCVCLCALEMLKYDLQVEHPEDYLIDAVDRQRCLHLTEVEPQISMSCILLMNCEFVMLCYSLRNMLHCYTNLSVLLTTPVRVPALLKN